jgi:phosphohistidine phosphatase
MKRLTLVRHAKSDWSIAGQPDWERTLNARGLKDAPEMGRRLRERKLKPDLILTSPAVRALTTATLLAKELGLPADKLHKDDRLYHATPTVILEVIRELGGSARHVMVVAHNPGLTEFSDQIASDRSIDHMPTCAVVTASVDVRQWTDLDWQGGKEVELDYPQNSDGPN